MKTDGDEDWNYTCKTGWVCSFKLVSIVSIYNFEPEDVWKMQLVIMVEGLEGKKRIQLLKNYSGNGTRMNLLPKKIILFGDHAISTTTGT